MHHVRTRTNSFLKFLDTLNPFVVVDLPTSHKSLKGIKIGKLVLITSNVSILGGFKSSRSLLRLFQQYFSTQ